MKKLTLLFIMLLCSSLVFSQAKEFKGTLTIKGLKIPIEGATVKVKSNKTVTTNHKGEFFIQNPEFPLRITFSKRNYVRITSVANTIKDTEFNMVLKDGVITQNEDISKGKNRAATGASSNVKLNNKGATTQSLVDQLRSTPGIQVRGGSVTIRGGSSINLSNAPLIMIDGVTYSGSILETGIDPNDIQSIRVIKGADAASYGMQGSNGVILIKTATSLK